MDWWYMTQDLFHHGWNLQDDRISNLQAQLWIFFLMICESDGDSAFESSLEGMSESTPKMSELINYIVFQKNIP